MTFFLGSKMKRSESSTLSESCQPANVIAGNTLQTHSGSESRGLQRTLTSSPHWPLQVRRSERDFNLFPIRFCGCEITSKHSFKLSERIKK